jgi:hypothetical protein
LAPANDAVSGNEGDHREAVDGAVDRASRVKNPVMARMPA